MLKVILNRFEAQAEEVITEEQAGLKAGRSISEQGPVVQSTVSLTSSLRGQLVKCFTTL